MPPMTPPKNTHPQVLPPEFYEWNQRTIQASHRNGTAITVEEALCYGPLAVHPILGDDDRIDDIPNGNQFVITSTYGGGRLLCATISADDAFKIVHRLVDNKVTCAALCKKDHLTIVAHLKQTAPWVIPWLMDCRQQGKYLSTKPYRKGIVS